MSVEYIANIKTYGNDYNLYFKDYNDNILFSFMIDTVYNVPNDISVKFVNEFITNKDCELRICDQLLIISEYEYCIIDFTPNDNHTNKIILKLLKNSSLLNMIISLFVFTSLNK